METRKHGNMETHTDSDEYSIVVFCKNATIMKPHSFDNILNLQLLDTSRYNIRQIPLNTFKCVTTNGKIWIIFIVWVGLWYYVTISKTWKYFEVYIILFVSLNATAT